MKINWTYELNPSIEKVYTYVSKFISQLFPLYGISSPMSNARFLTRNLKRFCFADSMPVFEKFLYDFLLKVMETGKVTYIWTNKWVTISFIKWRWQTTLLLWTYLTSNSQIGKSTRKCIAWSENLVQNKTNNALIFLIWLFEVLIFVSRELSI